ncbi:hypothetical protein CPC08DRAFT_764622 [Agrocybe pediades]|nr:hypothetical protein CPC08DRAFT_764622 [Agrocybe pediades]
MPMPPLHAVHHRSTEVNEKLELRKRRRASEYIVEEENDDDDEVKEPMYDSLSEDDGEYLGEGIIFGSCCAWPLVLFLLLALAEPTFAFVAVPVTPEAVVTGTDITFATSTTNSSFPPATDRVFMSSWLALGEFCFPFAFGGVTPRRKKKHRRALTIANKPVWL